MIRALVSPLVEIVKRIQRSRLRRIMRGYQALKRSGQLDRIAVVKQALTEHRLSLTRQHFSPVVMGCGADSGEIVVRQYLLLRVGGLNLNCALLLAFGNEQSSVVFPLPKEWRNVLVQHGFEVAHLRSAVLWKLYICALLLYGVVKISKIALAGIISGKNADPKPKCHAYFANLAPGNLPQEKNGNRSHDVISWYLQWSGKAKDIEVVQHSVARALPIAVGEIAVVPRQGPLPDLAGARTVVSYTLWGLRASLIATIDCLRGRWWHALLLNQAALAAQARTLPADSLAREYLFHNSGWIYRPLWTYEAERRGSAITFYFYSTNCENFKRSDGYPPLLYSWSAMTWPHYLVWDEYQADFVRRTVGESTNISVVGPIWFHTSEGEVQGLSQKTVAVFDVQPMRDAFYQTLGNDFDYYTPKTANQFLSDIYKALRECGGTLALKRKRKAGQLVHPKYRQFIEKFDRLPNFIAVDPDISALRLIEDCVAVISMPFTSTALFGRELGKPSIYYDPHGVIQKDDRAAHGIEIVSGPEELRCWLTAELARTK